MAPSFPEGPVWHTFPPPSAGAENESRRSHPRISRRFATPEPATHLHPCVGGRMAEAVAVRDSEDYAERFVPMGREAPLPIKPLPEPINWLHILGPGMVLTALGVGLGETFMWPRLVVVFGPEIRWLFLVGVTIQLFVMLEMARWTLATGESIFFGAARIHRAVMWFFWAAALFIYIWPGHISLGAQSLSTVLGGDIQWTWLAIAGIVLIALVLTFAPVVYSVVETVLSLLIGVLVIGSAIVAAMVGRPEEVLAT